MDEREGGWVESIAVPSASIRFSLTISTWVTDETKSGLYVTAEQSINQPMNESINESRTASELCSRFSPITCLRKRPFSSIKFWYCTGPKTCAFAFGKRFKTKVKLFHPYEGMPMQIRKCEHKNMQINLIQHLSHLPHSPPLPCILPSPAERCPNLSRMSTVQETTGTAWGEGRWGE